MNIPKITIEIGYNHLGSQFLFESLFDTLVNCDLDLTFQYRTTKINNFNPNGDLQLEIDYLIEIKDMFKKHKDFHNEIGIAIDSFDDYQFFSEHFDFIKVLSFAKNKKEFLSNVKEQKPIYFSCGIESYEEIDIYNRLSKKRKIPLNFIYTSFDVSGKDISKKEINQIHDINDLISFGLHQDKKEIIYVISSLFNLDRVFVYLNPGFRKEDLILIPDSTHSLNINEIKEIKEMLNLINNFKIKKSRNEFKNFKSQ